MAKRINVTYFNNYDNFTTMDEWYKEYQEWKRDCCDEDIDLDDIADNDVYDFIHTQEELDWDDFTRNLKHCKYASEPCVIIGSVGTWRGRREIAPTFEDVENAVYKCINSLDYISIKQVGGHLEICGSHHDGSNDFEIYLLNDKGIRAMERIEDGYGKADLSNKCYHKAIKGYLI